MTKAINLLKKNKIVYKIHKYEHDTSSTSYGLEAATKLNVSQDIVFKTLLVSMEDNTMAVAIVPISSQLSLKKIAKALGHKKAIMAAKENVQRSSGYLLGGVSPIAQKKALKTIIDESSKNYESIYVSAGLRGLEVELNPDDLCKITNAKFATII